MSDTERMREATELAKLLRLHGRADDLNAIVDDKKKYPLSLRESVEGTQNVCMRAAAFLDALAAALAVPEQAPETPEMARLHHDEQRVGRVDVDPSTALPCATSADCSPRPDHGCGERTGTNRESAAEVRGSAALAVPEQAPGTDAIPAKVMCGNCRCDFLFAIRHSATARCPHCGEEQWYEIVCHPGRAVPEQAPEISAPNATREAVHDAIARHIAPSKILGNIAWHEDEWRAMVAVTPSGPLQLRAFRVIVKSK